jgi:chemotaxis protein MotB
VPKLSLPNPTIPAEVRVRRVFSRRHGGAWKVAYADFATALMALFIVLWLMNAGQAVKKSVAGYFRDPRGYTQNPGAGPANSGEGLVIEQRNVNEIRKRIEQALKKMPEFDKIRDNVIFSVTGEGLRIDLLETDQGMFFVSGSPAPAPAGERLLNVLAGELKEMPNRLVVEGHTDARPFRNATPAAGYSNWELAADRANAARRLLHGFGLRTGQIVEVRGFADQRPFNAQDRDDPRNRRISIVVKFVESAA